MSDPIRVDIVSDVVCPWCIIGFLQLQSACSVARIGCEVYWHPFELNPQMPAQGQDLAEHLAEKYGTTPEQSAQARDRLRALGEGLGFTFNYSDKLRMHNTFLAHQLIHHGALNKMAHQTKLALFAAHFTDNRDIGDIEILADIAAESGLDRDSALTALRDGIHAEAVREEERFWTGQGITGVPAMVFERQYLVTGAQGLENYTRILKQIDTARAA